MTSKTGIPASHLFGVATFYNRFRLTPVGKNMVRVCLGTACHVQGGGRVHEVTREILDLGDEADTTDDRLFTDDALTALRQHTWPGNVRELANVVEHSMILRDDGPIDIEHLPRRFVEQLGSTASAVSLGPCTLRELEIRAIHAAIDRHEGSKPAAAEELGVSLKTLYNKLNNATSLSKTA